MSLKRYTQEFENVNAHIIQNNLDSGDVLDLILNQKSRFLIVEEAINTSELCAIINHPEKGIVYKFQCTDKSSRNFIFSDDTFYLIKLLDDETELLSYEQYADYSNQPIESKNNWFIIEQKVSYD